jgi:hypothetical protein
VTDALRAFYSIISYEWPTKARHDFNHKQSLPVSV